VGDCLKENGVVKCLKADPAKSDVSTAQGFENLSERVRWPLDSGEEGEVGGAFPSLRTEGTVGYASAVGVGHEVSGSRRSRHTALSQTKN